MLGAAATALALAAFMRVAPAWADDNNTPPPSVAPSASQDTVAQPATEVARVETVAPTTVAAAGEPPAPSPVSLSEQLLVGDKLQVSFFEQLNLGQGVDAGMNGDVRTFYQRLDLTGEHVVDADGSIAIPLVGRFVVEGMTADEAQSKITETYQKTMGRLGEVHIAVTDRLPVFVTGVVRAPGSFHYQPGMIAMQAIALAGGLDREAETSARLVEMQRERERHTQAVDRLERLMAKRIRLIQQRDLTENSKLPDATEAEGASDSLSDPLQGEMRLLKAESDAQSDEYNLQNAKVLSAQGRLDALKGMMELVERQIEVRKERLVVLQQMQGRGLATLEPLWNAQKDVADFDLQRERLIVETRAVEQEIAEAQAVRAKISSDHRVLAERDLSTVEDEISQQEVVADTSGEITSALQSDTIQLAQGTASLRLVILRRTKSGVSTLPGDETTNLMPGDVVKVDVMKSDQTAQTVAPDDL
jgi:protein involved in polysaccharide export with SLBB domain